MQSNEFPEGLESYIIVMEHFAPIVHVNSKIPKSMTKTHHPHHSFSEHQIAFCQLHKYAFKLIGLRRQT